jgi:PAS domain S-box-containing protein
VTADSTRARQDAPRPLRRIPRYALVLVVAAAVVTVTGVLLGLAYYDGQRAIIQRQVQDNLLSISKLKAAEIARWRQASLSQAAYMNVRKVGRVDIPPWLGGSDPAAAGRVEQMLIDTAKYRGFQRVIVYDPTTGLSLSSDGTTATAHEITAAKSAIEASAVTMQEPYLAGDRVYVDVTAPLSYADGTTVGLVMSIDLRTFLYPLIQTWPTPSTTAETLLARREGDSVIYLNDLRFSPDSALRMRASMAGRDLLAVQALEGKEGDLVGTDYRGQRVLGVAQHIPDSDWVLVAKMDEAEAYAPVRQVAIVSAAGVFALLLVLAAGLIAAWRVEVAATLRERAALAERYAFLSRNANDAVLLVDEGLTVREANDRAIDMYGYPREELIGMRLADLNSEVAAATLADDLRSLGEVEGSTLYETEHVRKDGTMVPVEVSARTQATDGTVSHTMIIRDIAERRSTEQALAESEEKYRGLFANAQVAMFRSRLDGSAILAANSKLCEIFGYSEQEMLDDPATIRWARPDARDAMVQGLRAARTLSDYEIDIVNSRGETRTCLVSMSLDPEKDYLEGSAADVTERKAAERELEGYRQHLESLVEDRTEELASANEELASTNVELASVNEELSVTNDELTAATRAKSEFLANMSHELRTPLNSIIGFTGVMLQGLAGDLTDEQRAQLAMVRRSGDRLLGLVSDMLDLSRIESGRLQMQVTDVDTVEIVGAAEQAVRRIADERGIELVIHAVPRGLVMRTDEGKIHQVLVNLLTNAIKFTDEGSVTLTATCPELDVVRFEVRDTGVGIDPEDLKAVFDEFVQLPRDGAKPEGTGLGLAISRRLAMLLGGTLSASSIVGQGSTFTLRLPLVYDGPSDGRGNA